MFMSSEAILGDLELLGVGLGTAIGEVLEGATKMTALMSRGWLPGRLPLRARVLPKRLPLRAGETPKRLPLWAGRPLGWLP